ncbi:exonuclease III [Escherichia coli]|uniref:Exonuclease III n=1 Tax=Escherichia coli TaxID=562 RepID=A0A377BAN0_ECOLX|nr:exonuclease III [Escherichia coli]
MAEIPSLLGNVTVINGYFPQGESRDHPIKFPAKAQFIRICKTTWKPNSNVIIRY